MVYVELVGVGMAGFLAGLLGIGGFVVVPALLLLLPAFGNTGSAAAKSSGGDVTRRNDSDRSHGGHAQY